MTAKSERMKREWDGKRRIVLLEALTHGNRKEVGWLHWSFWRDWGQILWDIKRRSKSFIGLDFNLRLKDLWLIIFQCCSLSFSMWPINHLRATRTFDLTIHLESAVCRQTELTWSTQTIRLPLTDRKVQGNFTKHSSCNRILLASPINQRLIALLPRTSGNSTFFPSSPSPSFSSRKSSPPK